MGREIKGGRPSSRGNQCTQQSTPSSLNANIRGASRTWCTSAPCRAVLVSILDRSLNGYETGGTELFHLLHFHPCAFLGSSQVKICKITSCCISRMGKGSQENNVIFWGMIPWRVCGNQRPTGRNQFSPFVRITGMILGHQV